MSLRYKFILAFVVFTAVVTAAFGIVISQHLNAQLRLQDERRAVDLAEHVAEEVLESQVFGIWHDPMLLARNLLTEDAIYAQIVLDGEVLAEQTRYSMELSLLSGIERIEIREVPASEIPSHLDVAYPLRDALGVLVQYGHRITPEGRELVQSGLQGYVRLGLSLEHVKQETRRESLLLAGVSMGLMALGILVGWGLYRMILSPIEHLSSAVREFGSGNLRARARVRSGDEIEALAHEFNTMAHSIVYQRDELRRTNEELERANQVKTTFLAAMSHELLTPLHSVLGYTSLLLDEVNVQLNDAGRQYIQAIQRAGKHLLALIENVLQFSKLEAGAERLRVTEVRAAEVVHEVAESQRPLADGKGLPVETEVDPDLILHTDATKLKQVLLNLLSNAIKYTEEGRVRVRAYARNGSVRFEVEDTGPGIDPKARPKLFEPFARVESTERGQRGVGLGLVVSKRYAEMMGGTLDFESVPGEGSRFWIDLPVEGPGREA
jgi:signal transduction histidine kinase